MEETVQALCAEEKVKLIKALGGTGLKPEVLRDTLTRLVLYAVMNSQDATEVRQAADLAGKFQGLFQTGGRKGKSSTGEADEGTSDAEILRLLGQATKAS